ncbi:MAG: NfeD family protein [Anaerolineae bacterium]|nr:NfeD family protein [Anaerolineae bacterium]
MREFFQLGPLNCIYFAFVTVGVLYALFVLIAGGLSDLDIPVIGDLLPDFGGDGPSFDSGEVGVTGISSAAIATFITAFGAFGIVSTQLFDVSGPVSIVWAIIGGILCGGVAQLVFGYILVKPQGSTDVTAKEIIGLTAEVITPIPADSVGEIAFVVQGGRTTSSARSAIGQAIARGTIVIVESMVGNIALVRPK